MYSFWIKCANVNTVVYGNLMVECNLIGRRRRHGVFDAIPLLAEKLRVNVVNFSAYIRFFVNVLIEMNEI